MESVVALGELLGVADGPTEADEHQRKDDDEEPRGRLVLLVGIIPAMDDGELALTFRDETLKDERGYWPLEHARKVLAAMTRSPGDGPEADPLWCGLLSLADAEEFVREARRLAPLAHPRGHYNDAVYERYGDAAFPWIADHFADGVLTNRPWNIMANLLHVGTPEAFRIVVGIEDVVSPVWDWREPARFLDAWVTRHPKVAFAELGGRVLAGDDEAKKLLIKLAKGRTRAALEAIGAAHGASGRATIEKLTRLRAILEPGEILAVLDQAQENSDMYAWPRFSYDFESRCEYTALRLVAARDKESDRWGIVLERVTGDNADEIDIQRFTYGSEVQPGYVIGLHPHVPPDVDLGIEGDEAALGVTVSGKAGSITITKELVRELDLRPGKGTEPDGGVGGPAVVALRAYHAKFPGAIWPPVEESVRALGLDPATVDVIAATEAFEHADGKAPSKTKSFKSLAKAIVERAPDAFDPGKPNTDWRKHARHKG